MDFPCVACSAPWRACCCSAAPPPLAPSAGDGAEDVYDTSPGSPSDDTGGDITLASLGGFQACPSIEISQAAPELYSMTSGLTLSDASASLSIDCSTSGGDSAIILRWDAAFSDTGYDWILRWRGEHTSALRGLIADRKIIVDRVPDGQTFSSADHVFYDEDDGYTYIAFGG